MFNWSAGYYAKAFIIEGYDQEEVGIPPSFQEEVESYTDAEEGPIVVKLGKAYHSAHSKDILSQRQMALPDNVTDGLRIQVPSAGTVLVPKQQKQMERIAWPDS